jgi:hypothetical protein
MSRTVHTGWTITGKSARPVIASTIGPPAQVAAWAAARPGWRITSAPEPDCEQCSPDSACRECIADRIVSGMLSAAWSEAQNMGGTGY